VRDQIVRQALEATNWDLMACSMPANVLLTTGYWPGAGYSLAITTRAGEILLIVPEDEEELAEMSWADDVRTYCPMPLQRLMTAEEPVYEAFLELRNDFGLLAGRVGFEQAEAFEPPAYAPHLYRGSGARILRRAFPNAVLAPADELLFELRARKTPAEIGHIKTVCRLAEHAFQDGYRRFRAGATEVEVASLFRTALTACSVTESEVKRCDGFTYCMSGPHSARAWGPYSRSRNRRVQNGESVIVRCHAYADGYWADVARTYFVGEPSDELRDMFETVSTARTAVIEEIRPGMRAREVDAVARSVIEGRGLGAFIKHASGHGAGFGALDHTARPRLHPLSDDLIEEGMVFKLELGVYRSDVAGVRMSDMLTMTDARVNVLTAFQTSLREVTIANV
jgi:Xaa-Pro aminopeptidase